jgi:hypothetical protein
VLPAAAGGTNATARPSGVTGRIASVAAGQRIRSERQQPTLKRSLHLSQPYLRDGSRVTRQRYRCQTFAAEVQSASPWPVVSDFIGPKQRQTHAPSRRDRAARRSSRKPRSRAA